MAEIVVLQADLENSRHQQAIVELVSAYARDPMGGGRDLPADVRRDLVPGLRGHPTTVVFLALDGDTPVGIAVCFVGFSTFAARPLINIHDLAVADGYRGRGIGRRLLERVEQHARVLGCCKLTLEVLADNTPAQALYRAAGFANLLDGGATARVWFLEKRL
jgi:ribosomal protein S18 acetylase RimI-like enzyme